MQRSRRLVLGIAAEAEGEGGTGRVAALTGASWQTVATRKAELDAGDEPPPGRQRRPSVAASRWRRPIPAWPRAGEADQGRDARGPGIAAGLDARSAEHLAGELTAAAAPCSDSTAWRMLRRMGFTQQLELPGPGRTAAPGAGRAVPAYRRAVAGVPGVRGPGDQRDSKKREKVGNFRQDGREWAPAGDPVTVRSHYFPDRSRRTPSRTASTTRRATPGS